MTAPSWSGSQQRQDLFTTLVARYEKRLINYVYRITHRYEDAHDLAQEIFVKVYLALDRYDPKYQFSTWLFRIAQNSAIDALRKKSIAEVPLVRPTEEEPGGKEREFARRRFAVSCAQNKQARGDRQAVEQLPMLSRVIQLRHRGALVRGDRFDEEAAARHGQEQALPSAESAERIARVIRGTVMTCEEYLQDPEANAAHVESCAECRAFEDDLALPIEVQHRPMSVDALPLASWEGASHRTWPLVGAGFVAALTLAIVLSAYRGFLR
jgi:RNA polymerase sigma factor (sigma-70 family)